MDQVWWCTIKWFLNYSKNCIAYLCKPNHDIINYSTSICPFESGRFGKEEKKSQKIEYLENEKSFLDEIKNIFYSSRRTIIWWKIKKLVSTLFYQIFIFSPNDSPLKTIQNVFYSVEKACFVLEIFNFLWFLPFLSTLSRFEGANRNGIIYDVMNWLA